MPSALHEKKTLSQATHQLKHPFIADHLDLTVKRLQR